jgi:hypothetical protein
MKSASNCSSGLGRRRQNCQHGNAVNSAACVLGDRDEPRVVRAAGAPERLRREGRPLSVLLDRFSETGMATHLP